MKKFAVLLLVLAMVFSFAACGGEKDTQVDVEPGLLRVAMLSDMATMDVAQTTDDYFVPMNVFDRLFEVKVVGDGVTDIVPSLVDTYSAADDSVTYNFTLKEGLKFSNGSALTASDVQFTFERLLTAGGVNDDIPLEVLGAAELQAGTADTLAGFAVADDLNFSITLAAPNAGFIAELTSPAISIVDKETFSEGFGMKIEETIGSGHYKVTEWVVNDHYTLEYNENYWGTAPTATKVVVNIVPDPSTQNLMYQNGELDMIDLGELDTSIVESTYKTKYADKIITSRRVGLTYFAMNANDEYLSDINVRKAIQMAVDRDAIVAGIFNNQATVEHGIIPAGVWGYNEDITKIPYDLEGAKKLLTDAGYAEGEVTIEIAMDSTSSSGTQLVIQVIQQNLIAAGINAQIKTYDESSWLALRSSGEMDCFVATWTMDYNDPANIMYTFYGSEAKTKIRSLNYADTEVMARVAAASSIIDDDARRAEYQALEEIIVIEDAAWLPLYENTHLFAIGDRVADFTPHWAGYTNFYAIDMIMK
ncbi:MAG: ABC transporter substrate-binding protein [Firmicutes bacterium]|nr:ABC transporter substrate-binding protein [Bacillota bacterium]